MKLMLLIGFFCSFMFIAMGYALRGFKGLVATVVLCIFLIALVVFLGNLNGEIVPFERS